MHFDVIIVGAGLSGIAAAYYMQSDCPTRTFAVLEGRDTIGGTWDLFRYPGIRSDSDMHTLGFGFYPWSDPKAIADGPSIMQYLHETVEAFDLDEQISFNRRVERASWSSEEALWTLTVRDTTTGSVSTYTCGFVWACTGYYRYEAGHTPDFEGTERFGGEIVHPQLWPEALDYSGKRVVVIGSGATAVTVVPEMAKTAAHVTMLQRSPTYVMSIPSVDRKAELLKGVFGKKLGSGLVRWKNILRIMFFYNLARRAPKPIANYIVGLVRRTMGAEYDVDAHFVPDYDPWDQRVCFVPDDDLFDALKSGRASVVTDHIDSFTETGIALKSGEHLDADIVVTATGLTIQVLGGTQVVVDGEPAEARDSFMYKGTMLSGVPNAAMSLGYTNASWTLKCELIAQYVTRLLNYMDEHGYKQCRPRAPENMATEPLIDFNSGYVLRALDRIPKQGEKAPWRLHQNYIFDAAVLRHQRIDDGVLEFS